AVVGFAFQKTPAPILIGETRGQEGPCGLRSHPLVPPRGPSGVSGALRMWPWWACDGSAFLHAPNHCMATDRDAGDPFRVGPRPLARGWSAAQSRGAKRLADGLWTALECTHRRPFGYAGDLSAPHA